MEEEQVIPRVVTAVGVAVSGKTGGRQQAAIIEKAMTEAVLALNAQGVSTEEKNSSQIRAAMEDARQRVRTAIATTPGMAQLLTVVVQSGGSVLQALDHVEKRTDG